jgi:hypothetical protein
MIASISLECKPPLEVDAGSLGRLSCPGNWIRLNIIKLIREYGLHAVDVAELGRRDGFFCFTPHVAGQVPG